MAGGNHRALVLVSHETGRWWSVGAWGVALDVGVTQGWVSVNISERQPVESQLRPL